MKKNQNSNNNDSHRSNLSSARSESSSERSESSKKTSISDDYKVQVTPEHLKDNRKVFKYLSKYF